MIAVLCALAAALCNAAGTVLQRRANQQVSKEDIMRLALMKDLLHRPWWYGGIGGMTGGFLLQALALSQAGLALVQPILAVELPITLVLGARVFRRQVDGLAVVGALTVTGGVAALVACADPRGGHPPGTVWPWVWAGVATVAASAALISGGLAVRGSGRAALLGCASGVAFGGTATLMKGALDRLASGALLGILTAWQLYAMIAVGIAAVYLTQNALRSGPLAAAQPAITTSEPFSSIVYGALLFHESIRLDGWLAGEIAGAILITVGSVVLSRSPASSADRASGHRRD